MLCGQNDRAFMTNFRGEYFSGELTDIWEHLYYALLRNPVSIMTTNRTADYVIKHVHSEGVKRGLQTM